MNAVTWSPQSYLHPPLFLFLHTPTSLPPLSARPPIGCEPRLRFLLWLWVFFFVSFFLFLFSFAFCLCAVTNEEPATVLEQKQKCKKARDLCEHKDNAEFTASDAVSGTVLLLPWPRMIRLRTRLRESHQGQWVWASWTSCTEPQAHSIKIR